MFCVDGKTSFERTMKRTVGKVLEEKNLNIDEYVLFSSKKSAGKSVEFMGKEYIFQELNEKSFDKKFDYALFFVSCKTSFNFYDS